MGAIRLIHWTTQFTQTTHKPGYTPKCSIDLGMGLVLQNSIFKVKGEFLDFRSVKVPVGGCPHGRLLATLHGDGGLAVEEVVHVGDERGGLVGKSPGEMETVEGLLGLGGVDFMDDVLIEEEDGADGDLDTTLALGKVLYLGDRGGNLGESVWATTRGRPVETGPVSAEDAREVLRLGAEVDPPSKYVVSNGGVGRLITMPRLARGRGSGGSVEHAARHHLEVHNRVNSFEYGSHLLKTVEAKAAGKLVVEGSGRTEGAESSEHVFRGIRLETGQL